MQKFKLYELGHFNYRKSKVKVIQLLDIDNMDSEKLHVDFKQVKG